MTEPPLDPRTVAESNMNIPPQNAWTFGQYTTHASVCWQYITMTNFPPTLDHRGYPIALWHNLRGFFTARSRYGVSNALLKKDYQIAVIEDLEDFLLLCSKHSRQAIANSWNRLHHPLPSIDAAFVGGRMRQALQNVADTRGFDVRYLSEELDHARWYTETRYVQRSQTASRLAQEICALLGHSMCPEDGSVEEDSIQHAACYGCAKYC